MTHPNELLFARHLAGELGPLARLRLRLHLRRCAECAKREREALAEKAAFDTAPERRADLQALLARVPASAAPAKTRRLPAWSFALATGTAAACALLLFARGGPSAIDPGLRPKGSSLFSLAVRTPTGIAPLGNRCSPGDALRARVRSEQPFLLLFNIDPAGEAHLLFPPDGELSARLPEDDWDSPGSWVLDETPGLERFVAVLSSKPLAASEVGPALARGDRHALAQAEVLELGCQKAAP